MRNVNHRGIILINLILVMGIGALRTWVSEKASWYALGVVGLFLIAYIIYHYQRYGTLKDQKRFPTEKEEENDTIK